MGVFLFGWKNNKSFKKVVILNAWNEWTEGSYLLPDTKTGTKYLEAVKNIFEKKSL